MYVVRRAEQWWFRKSVPLDLAEIVGVPELRRSLRTRDITTARRRALEVLVRVDEVYAILRSKRPLKPTRDLALAMLDEALRLNSGTAGGFSRKAEFVVNVRGVIENLPVDQAQNEDDGAADRDNQAPLITKSEALSILRQERPAAKDNEIAVSILEAVDEVSSAHWTKQAKAERALDSAMGRLAAARSSNPEPTNTDIMLAKLCSEIMTALAATRAASPPAWDIAELKAIVASEIKTGLAEADASRWSAEHLSILIKRYEDVEVIKLRGLKHAEDIPRRLLNFLQFTGDKPVKNVTREDLKNYRDSLDQLPDRFKLRLKVDDMRQAIKLNNKRLRPFAAIGATTINLKYLGPVRRFFEWLVSEGLIEKNPVENIHSGQVVVESAKSKRLPLKPDQISRIFASTAQEPKWSALYWLPPLMLFSGARLNELAQLRTDDIRLDYNGRPHLSVLCLDEDQDEAADDVATVKRISDDRGVKSAAARRLIPIHPVLLSLGFLGFVKSRRERLNRDIQLFSDLKPNRFGNWSAAISKKFNRRIRSLGIMNPRLTAYSLRHNFRDACVSASMPQQTRMKMMGHQLQGMDAVYGNPRPLPEESAAIDRIEFEGVDLQAYTAGSNSHPVNGDRRADRSPRSTARPKGRVPG